MTPAQAGRYGANIAIGLHAAARLIGGLAAELVRPAAMAADHLYIRRTIRQAEHVLRHHAHIAAAARRSNA